MIELNKSILSERFDTSNMLQFIKHYPNLKNCSIQTFDDVKVAGREKNPALADIFSFDDGWISRCENLNKQKAGIYFSVNSMLPGKRNKESVTAINAWICDIDGGNKEKQMEDIKRFPIRPSSITESKNGYHCYWLAKDGTQENWPKICTYIAEELHGDMKIVKDTARVLRLPGFYHWKDPVVGYLVSCLYIDPSLVYEEEVFLSLISKKMENIKDNNIREIISSRDSKEMLLALSGNGIINGDTISFSKNANGTEQIVVSSIPSSCRIDADGYIGSLDDGGPSRIQWVLWYGNVTKSELLTFVKQNFSRKLLQGKKVEQQSLVEDTISYGELLEEASKTRQSLSKSSICSYGLKVLDEYIGGILPSELVVIGADSGLGKSELAYIIALENARNGKKVLLLALEGDLHEIALRHLQRLINEEKVNLHLKTSPYRFNLDSQIKVIEEKVIKNMSIEIKDNLRIFKKIQIPTLQNVRDLIMRWKDWADMIIIDHLHYIYLDRDDENREIGLVMRELKTITDIIKKPIVLVSHLRKKDQRATKDKDPEISDLYGSSNIGKEATTVLLLARMLVRDNPEIGICELPDDEFDKRYAGTKIILAKSRIGLPKGVFSLIYDREGKKYPDLYQCIIADESEVKEDEKISLQDLLVD